MSWIVLKFGGTSVSSREKWEAIESVIRKRMDSQLMIVCSALAGVSDELNNLLTSSEKKRKKIYNDIIKKHEALAKDLDIDLKILEESFLEFSELVSSLPDQNISPKIKASVFAYGEIFSTKLGFGFLKSKGLDANWCDARDFLIAEDDDSHGEERRYLSSSCGYEPDKDLQKLLKNKKIIITQGFISKNRRGETVLLGRGGSDISAAYFSTKLNAERCEIWTDVPGMYTANPRLVPTARHLTALDYDEALEIALSGAKVLHPRTITPVRKYDVPLHIYSLDHPSAEGTIISVAAGKKNAEVKAISARFGVTVLSMETLEMWHRVGFLADAFGIFKKHGLSIDLISTSESNVTVTLDRDVNVLEKAKIDALTKDLEGFCKVRVISSCALVNLVGRNIRSIMYRLAPALEVFNEQRIYLIAQAANDLNLTFVVDEEQAERLVAELHEELFQHQDDSASLGASWQDLFEEEKETRKNDEWWVAKKDKLIDLARGKSPLYVYDEETIDERIRQLQSIRSLDKIYYSIKANSNPEILKQVYNSGLNFECVSIGELTYIKDLFSDMDPQRILFTPNFASPEEYKRGFESGVIVTLDNLYPIQKWPEIFKNRDLFVRVDPGTGQGHHKYVKTAGSKSKFGISFTELEELVALVKNCGSRIIGLHSHVGSNIHTPDTWSKTAETLLSLASMFSELKVLDLGGGLGIVERPGQEPLDLKQVDDNLAKIKEKASNYELWIEPGRFVVAEAGVLLAKVTQTKRKGDYFYVGLDVGMNTLIRPALYGSHHEIVNLSRYGERPTTIANIVGPICETGDVLGYSRKIVPSEYGDIFLISTTGAYGRVMSSNYNMRSPAEEVFLNEYI